jgi:hypothetical protein
MRLAARLSENPGVSALLLEAGAAESPAGAEHLAAPTTSAADSRRRPRDR